MTIRSSGKSSPTKSQYSTVHTLMVGLQNIMGAFYTNNYDENVHKQDNIKNKRYHNK